MSNHGSSSSASTNANAAAAAAAAASGWTDELAAIVGAQKGGGGGGRTRTLQPSFGVAEAATAYAQGRAAPLRQPTSSEAQYEQQQQRQRWQGEAQFRGFAQAGPSLQQHTSMAREQSQQDGADVLAALSTPQYSDAVWSEDVQQYVARWAPGSSSSSQHAPMQSVMASMMEEDGAAVVAYLRGSNAYTDDVWGEEAVGVWQARLQSSSGTDNRTDNRTDNTTGHGPAVRRLAQILAHVRRL
ncbi:hypothetical protein RI367_003701 [Sorochytrium milnesiophthora]